MNARESRSFFLPFVYGLAAANFVAVIQLISAPHLQEGNLQGLEWGNPLTPSQARAFIGFIGMTLSIVSIPLLIGYALHSESAIRAKHEKDGGNMLVSLSTIGLLGLAATLAGFNRMFGVAFFAAIVTSGVGVSVALHRLKKRRKPN